MARISPILPERSTRRMSGTRFWLATGSGAAVLFVATGLVVAGPGGSVVGVAEREIARRNDLAREAGDLLQVGNAARDDGDLVAAVEAYRRAFRMLPDAPVYRGLRGQALAAYSEASVAYAHQLATQGRYDDANAAVDAILMVDVNPEYRPALRLKQQIQDPERYNPALTPEHVTNVQRVQSLLTMANGHYDLGDFDKATAAFNGVLALDPYNTAARRGLERTERAISGYAESARDHTRADALRQVDEQWAEPVPAIFSASLVGPVEKGGQPAIGAMSAREKIKAIILPQAQIIDATLDEAVEFLTIQARNYDTIEADPALKGVNLVVGAEPGLGSKRVSLSLTNVPLSFVLQNIAEQAGTRVQVEDFMVRIGSLGGVDLVTRHYRVPPGFFSQAPAATTAMGADPFSTEKPADGGLAFARVSAADFLRSNGITFPDGSAAYFSAATSTLTFRNTLANHDLVQSLIEQSGTGVVKQVRLKVVMLETNQENLKEFGFDWLLGAFDVTSGVFAAGGTAGNTGTGDEASVGQNFPIAPPGGAPVGQFPLTAGNRSGNGAVRAASIDALVAGSLRNPATGVKAPATFGLSGVFTDPQFQVVMRGLNQKKGVDIMAAPSVIAKSGQRARIQIIREFPYPTEFEPPEIPQDFGSNQTSFFLFDPLLGLIGAGGGGGGSGSFPITPTTPTAFEFKNVGHELEVEATIGPDGHTIEIDVAPAYRAFEGMINYGTPILIYPDGQTPTVLTENRIPQPVFRTNRTTGIKVSLWSGSTMVIAGLAGEERISVEDKTPIFGDLPFIGKFYRSSVTQIRQKSIVFMVSAQIVDPSGESPRIVSDGAVADALPESTLLAPPK